MLLLGGGFGLGVAIALSRLLANVAPELKLAGGAACVVIGLAVTVLVVHIRGLLRDRALLDRWVGEATAQLQTAVEQLVATRVLTAESSLTAALGEQDEGESARVAEQVGVIDTELREHSVVGARAAALRGREMPTLKAALEAVRAELGEVVEADDEADDEAEVTSDDAGPASEISAASDGGDGEIDENSPTNTADNVF